MKPTRAQVAAIEEDLLGTCRTLEEICDQHGLKWEDVAGEITDIEECQQCNWWVECCECDEEGLCSDCYSEKEE